MKIVIDISDSDYALIKASVNKTSSDYRILEGTILSKAFEERPKSKWLPRTSFDGFTYWRCDNCKVDVDETTDYCPHCGADMRK